MNTRISRLIWAFLQEAGRSGPLYHSTSVSSALSILTSNTLKGSRAYHPKEQPIYQQSGVSLTRNKTFAEGWRDGIILVLDHDKLARDYKIVPRDYFFKGYFPGKYYKKSASVRIAESQPWYDLGMPYIRLHDNWKALDRLNAVIPLLTKARDSLAPVEGNFEAAPRVRTVLDYLVGENALSQAESDRIWGLNLLPYYVTAEDFTSLINKLTKLQQKLQAWADTREYDEEGYDQDGYNREGFDENGFDKDGYDEDGFDHRGYDRDGYDEDGYNEYGYDRDGYDADGYDENGYDSDGYDAEGYDKQGYNEYGESKYGDDEENDEASSGDRRSEAEEFVPGDIINLSKYLTRIYVSPKNFNRFLNSPYDLSQLAKSFGLPGRCLTPARRKPSSTPTGGSRTTS